MLLRNIITTSIHVCYGASAGGSLLTGGFETILAFGHTFEGRIKDFKTYEDYETASQKSLQSIYQFYKTVDGFDMGITPLFHYKKDQASYIPLSSDQFIKIIGECDNVIVWLSWSFSENLLLAFLIRLFVLYALPLEKIKTRRIETQFINGESHDILGIGMVPPEGLKKAAASISLQQFEIDLLIQGWEAITSPTPEKMEAYLGIPPTTRFQEGLKDFRNRLPSSKTGLNRCQTDLLDVYPLDQVSVSANWLLGTVVGKNLSKGYLDTVGDGYVMWYLMQMTSHHASRPAFIITSPYTREQQVALAHFGRALREGKANWLDENPVDYYVGGLHVNSKALSI